MAVRSCWAGSNLAITLPACTLAVQPPALSPTQQRYPSQRWRAAADAVAADKQQSANVAIAPVAADALLA